jgi:hypothetical protein
VNQKERDAWNRLLKNDPVKAGIAASIQRFLKVPSVPGAVPVPDVTDADVVVQAFSPLETMIRVKRGNSVRYFMIRVSESF